MTQLTMPELSSSMEEGTILSWLKRDGEQVEAGEDLLEIETDKATVTHAAEVSGVLTIVAREGTTLPVGATIGRLDAAGERHPAPAPETTVAPIALDMLRPGDLVPMARTPVKATPLARRVAEVHGVALEDVTGSGPRGRVTRADVLASAPPPPATDPVVPATPRDDVEVVELTRLQALIARRMAEATATVPHFQVQTEVQMDAAMALRERFRTAAVAAPSLNDMIVKAAALALREHPLANGAYRDGAFELHRRVNVGIAVAAEGALVVPTIHDADRKTLGTIARESRELAERVRAGTVTPAELEGATFTVSNLGMYGMTAMTPVINAPQAAILGVGAIREALARIDGEIVDRRLLTLTLSCDHRILYGADASRFLSELRELLENPLRLTL
jgi:pyruvate dehydrogenase E2 component (dihydrolipoyllysine-residue acetyltransferase)